MQPVVKDRREQRRDFFGPALPAPSGSADDRLAGVFPGRKPQSSAPPPRIKNHETPITKRCP
ncbi:MAG: hypothetical protein OXL36_14195 [Bryobacterales bacterium]|nr:hypothetical protein [Bryobacterales bacterium]MDE0293673.1 hypothetical protein [Bryobacterales bacterium]